MVLLQFFSDRLTAALMLHARGIDCEVYEQTESIRELGVGINTLPHSIRELAGLGLHQEKRIDPRVAAGDDHRMRRLATGELGETLAVLRVHIPLKGANAGDDVVHVPQS